MLQKKMDITYEYGTCNQVRRRKDSFQNYSREKRTLIIFENRDLGRIFEPKMDKKSGQKLHNEELNILYR